MRSERRSKNETNEVNSRAPSLSFELPCLLLPPSLVRTTASKRRTHVSGVGSNDSGGKGESSGLGGRGDSNSLQVGESRVLERVDVSEVSRLRREDGSLDGSLDDEGVRLPEEEPLKIGRHLGEERRWKVLFERRGGRGVEVSSRRFVEITERVWKCVVGKGRRESCRECRIKGSPLN